MALVRTREEQAEFMAHLLDDLLRIPGTRLRMGVDPLVGLLPIVGDMMVTAMGASLLLIARQLDVPWPLVLRMWQNQVVNGLIGSVPFFGDAYSFHFKSNAINASLLLRAVKRGADGTCAVSSRALRATDLLLIAGLTLPTLAIITVISVWFWEHNMTLLSLLFPTPYRSQ